MSDQLPSDEQGALNNESAIRSIQVKLNSVDSGFRFLRHELLGSGEFFESDKGEGLVENVTVRQILEELAYNMKDLKTEMTSLKKDIEKADQETDLASLKTPGEGLKSLQETPDSKGFRPEPIVQTDVSSFQGKLAREFEGIIRPEVLQEGITCFNKSAEEIAADRAHEWTPIIIDIHNYLDMSLWNHNPHYSSHPNQDEGTKCLGTVNSSVGPAERQIFQYSVSGNKHFGAHPGIVPASQSFIIGTTSVKMMMELSKTFCRFGFVSVQDAHPGFYDQIRFDPWTRKDSITLKRTGDELYLNHGLLRARVTALRGIPHYVLKVEIGSGDPEKLSEYRVRRDIEAMIPSMSYNSELTARRMSAVLVGLVAGTGCCIKIGNATGVGLVDPFVYFPDGKRGNVPQFIPPLSSAFILGSYSGGDKDDTKTFKGCLSFRLEGTSARLVVSFYVQADDNYFEVGLVPECGVKHEPLCSRNQVSNRHFASGLAPGGEISASVWNVHVSASMTNERKAALSVLLYTSEP